jgi:hypothetical protein
VYGVRVLCYVVKFGAGDIINYDEVIHVSCVKGYVFGIQ